MIIHSLSWDGLHSTPQSAYTPNHVRREIEGRRIFNRCVRAGDTFEIRQYERGVRSEFENIDLHTLLATGEIAAPKKNKKVLDIQYLEDSFAWNEYKQSIRIKSSNRAKQEIRRLINANVYQYNGIKPKFLTVTFAECVKDLNRANYEWMKFIQRLNYYVQTAHSLPHFKAKYLVVVEFQDGERLTKSQKMDGVTGRNAVHYHAVFFNLPFIAVDKNFYTKRGLNPNVNEKFISEIWGNGSVVIEAIKDREGKTLDIEACDNVGAYIAEYLGGAPTDGRLDGKRKYFPARNLYRAQIETHDETVQTIIQKLDALNWKEEPYKAEFESRYIGKIKVLTYNLRRAENPRCLTI